jgi:opacity protein-like surface antigen
MRKTTIVAVLVLLASLAVAQTPKIGAGVFGGLSIPLVQDDQKSGTVFGLRGRLSLLSFLSGEAQLAFTKWGQGDPVEGIVMPKGSKITQFGVNALLGGGPGPGVKPYFIAGMGSYKIKNDETKDELTRMGYSAGLGLGIGLGPKFGVDVRGELVVVPLEEGGSKKAAQATAGVMVNF